MCVVLELPPISRIALRNIAQKQRPVVVDPSVLHRLMMAELVGQPTELLPSQREKASRCDVPAVVLQDKAHHDENHHFDSLSSVELGSSHHETITVDFLSKGFKAFHNLLLLNFTGIRGLSL